MGFDKDKYYSTFMNRPFIKYLQDGKYYNAAGVEVDPETGEKVVSTVPAVPVPPPAEKKTRKRRTSK
jgi:hypothetical protein